MSHDPLPSLPGILDAACIDQLAQLAEDKAHHAEHLFVNPWVSHSKLVWGDRSKVFVLFLMHCSMHFLVFH